MAINLTKHLVILVNCICLSISSFPSCVFSTYMRFSKKTNAENNFYLIWNANAKWHTTTSFDRSWRSSNKLHHRIVPPLHFGGAKKTLHIPNYIYLCKEFFSISISVFCFLLHTSKRQTILCCFFLYLEDWIFDIMDQHSLKAEAPGKR